MKKQILYDLPETTAAASGFTALSLVACQQASTDNPVPLKFPHACSELAELRLALSAAKQQLVAIQQQNDKLLAVESRQKRKLVRLATMCGKALHFANHDELTGLANRGLLQDRLKQTLARAARQHKKVALLFIDLDKFKNVNDDFGHAIGDKLLQQVAQRLSACIRAGDTACRYGGDEFVVMIPEIDGQEAVVVIMDKIRDTLTEPYVLGGKSLNISSSIGVAIYSADRQNYQDLIKQADVDMYLAKSSRASR